MPMAKGFVFDSTLASAGIVAGCTLGAHCSTSAVKSTAFVPLFLPTNAPIDRVVEVHVDDARRGCRIQNRDAVRLAGFRSRVREGKML